MIETEPKMNSREAHNIRARIAFYLRDREGMSFDDLRMIFMLRSRWVAQLLCLRGEKLYWGEEAPVGKGFVHRLDLESPTHDPAGLAHVPDMSDKI